MLEVLLTNIAKIAIPAVVEVGKHFTKRYVDRYLVGPQNSLLVGKVEQSHLASNELQGQITESVYARNGGPRTRMETMAVEAAVDFFKKDGIELQALGGPGLVDAVGLDPKTNQLVCVEIKGTGMEKKGFNQLGLMNDARVENSPAWLDNQMGRLLERLNPETNSSINPQLSEKLVQIANDGGFEMSPESYRSELYIAARAGAMELDTQEAQDTLGKWSAETGSARVILDEAPPSFVDLLLKEI